MHLHIDCQFGMAGDMFLASLIDAGADQEAVVRALRAIPLDGFAVECSRTARGGVAAMLLNVRDLTGVTRTGQHTHDHSHDRGHHDHDHSHSHDHGHGHEAGHTHSRGNEAAGPDHSHGEAHEHPHPHDHDHIHAEVRRHTGRHRRSGPHRHLSDLLNLLDSEAIPLRVKERASRIFHILARAEATVHGMPLEKVHFHEISGIDTAVDVIGSCFALELLEADSISASPVSVGSGMLMCEHGVFPVPAPATLEILKSSNIPWRSGGEGERATPTGAAILAGLAESFGDAPEITVTRIGYGAGHREFSDAPNLLRTIVGKPGSPAGIRRPSSSTIITEAEPEPGSAIVPLREDGSLLPAEIAAQLPGETAPEGDRVAEFRFVVDDMTPEAVAYMCERCLAAGALEAYAVAAVMKKGRAGHEVTVLAADGKAGQVADVIWRESTTFGMRVSERSRLILPREVRTVSVMGHTIRVKIGWRGGAAVRRQPEYEDCRAAAQAEGMALTEIFTMAAEAARSLEGL